MSKSTTVTAAEVREFFRANEKRMASLSAAAQATVREGARGRLHPQAVKVHNSRRRTRQYVLGASGAEAAARKAERATLVEKGLAGRRGPLSKAAKETLSQSKG